MTKSAGLFHTSVHRCDSRRPNWISFFLSHRQIYISTLPPEEEREREREKEKGIKRERERGREGGEREGERGRKGEIDRRK